MWRRIAIGVVGLGVATGAAQDARAAGSEPAQDPCLTYQVVPNTLQLSTEQQQSVMDCFVRLRRDLERLRDALASWDQAAAQKAADAAALAEALRRQQGLAELCRQVPQDGSIPDACPGDKPTGAGWSLPFVGSLNQPSGPWRLPARPRAYLIEARGVFFRFASLIDGACGRWEATGENPGKRSAVLADFEPHVELCRAKIEAYQVLKDVSRRQGIDRRLTGLLVPALGVTRTHGPDGAETGFQQRAFVRFATRAQERALGLPLAFRVAGRFGVDPVFNVAEPVVAENVEENSVKITPLEDGRFRRVRTGTVKVDEVCRPASGSTPESCEPNVLAPARPEFAEAFVWDLGADVIFGGGGTELTLYGRAGQALSLQDFKVVKDKDGQPQASVYADFDTDNRWYFEGGARLALYPDGTSSGTARRLANVRPTAELVYAWRDERRFRGLTGFGRHPERRQLLRLTLQRLPVFGLDGDRAFDLNFAVEHEWSRGDGLRSGTRLYLQGSLDLSRL